MARLRIIHWTYGLTDHTKSSAQYLQPVLLKKMDYSTDSAAMRAMILRNDEVHLISILWRTGQNSKACVVIQQDVNRWPCILQFYRNFCANDWNVTRGDIMRVKISLLTLNFSILHVNIAMMFNYRNIQNCIVLAVSKIESREGQLKQTCKTLFSAMKKVATLTPSNPAFRLQILSP